LSLLILFGFIFAAFLLWIIWQKLRQSHRNKLFLKEFPAEWIPVLQNNVSIYALLPEQLKQNLHGWINIFLDEKEFFACAGFQIDDEVRVTIAANACLLLLGRDKGCFPGFTSILIYPDTYVAKETKYDGLIEVKDDSVRSGESWHRGPVVLSWSDVLHGSLNKSDGHNVVLHEFAHKLDEENKVMDGLPVLRDPSHYADWAAVLSKEYESLLIRVNKGTNSVIDGYGAVSPPEFFAVATESFFEKPRQMKTKLPELYEQLEKFYHLDPASWRKPL
jgi:MtfA peptidase